MIVLTSDWQQIEIRSRGERAPMAWDEGREAREGANRFDGLQLAAR